MKKLLTVIGLSAMLYVGAGCKATNSNLNNSQETSVARINDVGGVSIEYHNPNQELKIHWSREKYCGSLLRDCEKLKIWDEQNQIFLSLTDYELDGRVDSIYNLITACAVERKYGEEMGFLPKPSPEQEKKLEPIFLKADQIFQKYKSTLNEKIDLEATYQDWENDRNPTGVLKN